MFLFNLPLDRLFLSNTIKSYKHCELHGLCGRPVLGLFLVFSFCVVSEQLWLCNGQVEDSTVGDLFYPLNGTEHGSPPSMTTRDRELVYVLEVRIEPGDLNPQTITLQTLPRAGGTLLSFSACTQHFLQICWCCYVFAIHHLQKYELRVHFK